MKVDITIPMAQALAKFHEIRPEIELDGEVKFKGVNFKYATLANIVTSIKASLKDAGLTFVQIIDSESSCLVTKVICIEDGSSFDSYLPMNFTGDPKQVGGNITYFKRYSLCAALGIVAEDDKDHEGTLNNVNPACSDAAFQKILDRIMQGESGLFEKALATYTLDPLQIKKLVRAEDTVNDTPKGLFDEGE